MIPNSSLDYVYMKLAGQTTVLSIAQAHLLANLDRVRRAHTHTFLSCNGQTERGVSHNDGAERFYCWPDTIIDCRNSPALPDSPVLKDFFENTEGHRKFRFFSEDLMERSGRLLRATAFHSVIRGTQNMRYNICEGTKIEDFDTIRVGLRLSALSAQAFEKGLKNLRESEKPYKLPVSSLVN